MAKDPAISPGLSHATREKIDEGSVESLSAVEVTQEKIRLNNPNVDYTRCRDTVGYLSARK
jgi:translation initiation factor eIF-2B subunit alpha